MFFTVRINIFLFIESENCFFFYKEQLIQTLIFSHYLLTPILVESQVSVTVHKTTLELHRKNCAATFSLTTEVAGDLI